MSRSRIVAVAYLAALSAELAAILFELNEIRLFSKGSLMPLLILYAIISADRSAMSFKLLLGGLIFSWVGDLLLLFDQAEANLFVFGLASFLIAHLLYIACYRKARYDKAESGLLPTQEMRYLFILVLAGSAIVWILFPHLGNLMIPVIVHAAVLTLMAIAALYRFGKTPKSSFTFVFIGALLFMASDSILAINKFVEPISEAGFWVMLTYGVAQLFIVSGIVQHSKIKI